MTTRDCSSSCFSWWSVALLFWGSMTLGSLVELQFTTPGTYTTGMTHDYDHNQSGDGYSHTTLGCGNKTQNCNAYCQICEGFDRMMCLSWLIQETCILHFKIKMDLHNSSEWCVWNNVRSAYNNFTICTEEIAECLLIPWPNPMVENTFVEIHATYFHDCPTEELSDPPPTIILALVMTPICLIPVIVVLVVLMTKNGDGSS